MRHLLRIKLHTSPTSTLSAAHTLSSTSIRTASPIGGFADARQVDDVAGGVASQMKEEPEAGITEHCVETSLSSFPLVAWPRVESRRRGLFYHTGQQLCGHCTIFCLSLAIRKWLIRSRNRLVKKARGGMISSFILRRHHRSL